MLECRSAEALPRQPLMVIACCYVARLHCRTYLLRPIVICIYSPAACVVGIRKCPRCIANSSRDGGHRIGCAAVEGQPLQQGGV